MPELLEAEEAMSDYSYLIVPAGNTMLLRATQEDVNELQEDIDEGFLLAFKLSEIPTFAEIGRDNDEKLAKLKVEITEVTDWKEGRG
jgi:hypothetical protein